MGEKYFNDAVIGNKNIRSSYSKKGELLRMYYGSPDYKQYIEYMDIGIKINDSNLIHLHQDINNIYNQYYTEDTNILNTEIKNTYFNLRILQTDFVPIKKDVLIKRYKFLNENNIDLDVHFLIHSKLLSNENDFVGGKVINSGLMQYNHSFAFCTFSQNVPVESHQLNDCDSNIESGTIQDKDYIGMSSDSSISYHIGVLKPLQEAILEIMLYIKEENFTEDSVLEDIKLLQKLDIKKELQDTKNYWRKYIKDHEKINLNKNTDFEIKIKDIYHRTILLYPLLTNQETGGIAAAIEVDEKRTQCGRYSYCWPRDAVFIAKAMDILNMSKETEKFYKIFCKQTQSKNGMWEQRFYTDGKLAPCWGYQIDETASVVYGVYDHYNRTKDTKFLKDNLKMLENAINYLEKYIAGIITEKYDFHVSYDLWEMNEGIHLYSLASIYAAFEAMIQIYDILDTNIKENRLKREQVLKQKTNLKQYLLLLKEYVLNHFYNDNTKSLKRNLKDELMDISILGSVIPFKMFTVKEKKIINTIEKINLTLRTYTGGYKRFEEDHYRGGNPWIISTLWMALYYLENKQKNKAKECLEFVVKTATEHGFLAEQIDNNSLKPNWVIGLGWSHAMFIIVIDKLFGNDDK